MKTGVVTERMVLETGLMLSGALKFSSNNFEPEYPLNNQTSLFSPYPLYKEGEKVSPLSDPPFFSSPPCGLCNAGGLAADVPYSHLDTKDATYLLGT